MVPTVSRLEEGRSDFIRPPAHLEAAEPVTGIRGLSYCPDTPPGACTTCTAIQKIEKKREVTGLYESGAGPTRRERRA